MKKKKQKEAGKVHRACNSCDQKRKAKAQRTSMCLSRIAATGKQKKKKKKLLAAWLPNEHHIEVDMNRVKKKKTVCFLRFYWYVIKSGRCPLLTKVNLCVCVRACVRACATQRKENENTVTRARMGYSKQCRTISEIKKKR